MYREPLEEQWIALLVLWFKYESQYSPVKGYPSECPSARDYRTSRQYDDMRLPDRDGIIREPTADVDARGREAARIGNIVRALGEPHTSALYELAASRAPREKGTRVWRSARLPLDEVERAHVVAEALERFGMMV